MPLPRTTMRMPHRTTAVLLATLAAATALAGCFGGDDGGGAAATTPAPTTTTTPPAATPTGSAAPQTPSVPQTRPAPVEDAGAIQGPFDKTWAIDVPRVGATGMSLVFSLAGVEAGAPVTARVNLVLADPDGAPIKTAVVGLGGEADSVSWMLTPSEVARAGTYSLQATAGDPTGGQAPAPLPVGVPSGGLANFGLYAQVEY